MKATSFLFALGLATLPCVGAAQGSRSAPPAIEPLDPGLWEQSVKTEGFGGAPTGAQLQELQRQMASMPPEQRKQMEAILAAQSGSMAHSERVCVTPEEAAKGPLAIDPEDDDDCVTEYGARQGKRLPMTLRCKEPPSEGTGEMVFESRRAFSMQVQLTIREPGEPPRQARIETKSRWIAADCGDVKP